jgi:hypothetical protein
MRGPWHEARDAALGGRDAGSVIKNQALARNRVARCEVSQFSGSHFAFVDRSDESTWAIPGMFGWKVGKAIRLRQPIPISGQLGVWALPPVIRLCLAIHIREQCASTATSGSAPLDSSARVVADGKGVYLQHPAKPAGDGSAIDDPCCPKYRWQLSTETWLQLERRVSEALQQVKEREAELAARRRAKMARFHAARALLAPGIIVNVHQSWLDCETPPSEVPEAGGGALQVTDRGTPRRFGRRRPCAVRRGSGATMWRAVCLIRRRGGSGSEWLAVDASARPMPATPASTSWFSVDLSCGAFEKAWHLASSSGFLQPPAPSSPQYCEGRGSSPSSSFAGVLGRI